MSEDFKIWWHREGSGMPPRKGEEACEHVERVSAIAWSNGAYKAKESLEAENARLKAEVERLQSVSEAWKKRRLDKVEAECIKWAEVEKENAYLKKIVESHQVDLHLQNARLKAEVERLTKIGDAMAEDLISEFGASDNAYFWYKAKEGKQP